MDGCCEKSSRSKAQQEDTIEVVILQSHKGSYLYSYNAAHRPKCLLLHTVGIVFYDCK